MNKPDKLKAWNRFSHPSNRRYVYDFFLHKASMMLRVDVQCETMTTFSSVFCKSVEQIKLGMVNATHLPDSLEKIG
jgi:hypothetical protein